MPKQVVRRALVALSALTLMLAFAGVASAAKYVVIYKAKGVPANGGAVIRSAGGTVVASYAQIGVVVAESNSSSFQQQLSADNRIESVSLSDRPMARVDLGSATETGDLPNVPASDADSFSALQWDMRQIHAPEAHEITGGSPAVLVGDIDTGIDFTHPDLAPNIDVADSVNCVSGAPVPGLAAQDDAGHGTHTAGTIAAASNGIGIVGVAPNVRIAGIKSGNADGYFFPESVICGFMWAATHGVDVTNNSYYMDPYLYNCRNDADQRALWKAAKRAVDYAQQNGVTVVAAQGNDADDRAHPTYDASSPDDPPGAAVERRITNACVVIPGELDGVIGVTAVGNTKQVDANDDPDEYLKSYYSAYGVGSADVTAPGGDFYYGRGTDAEPFGLVLSTWPSYIPCGRSVHEPPGAPGFGATYCYLQGTSMASPHAAGVAALIISRFGKLNNPSHGKMRPGAVQALLEGTADAQPCPTELPLHGAPGSSRANTPYAATTRPDGSPQECQGGEGYNSWYGHGQVNALRAVLHDTGS